MASSNGLSEMTKFRFTKPVMTSSSTAQNSSKNTITPVSSSSQSHTRYPISTSKSIKFWPSSNESVLTNGTFAILQRNGLHLNGPGHHGHHGSGLLSANLLAMNRLSQSSQVLSCPMDVVSGQRIGVNNKSTTRPCASIQTNSFMKPNPAAAAKPPSTRYDFKHSQRQSPVPFSSGSNHQASGSLVVQRDLDSDPGQQSTNNSNNESHHGSELDVSGIQPGTISLTSRLKNCSIADQQIESLDADSNSGRENGKTSDYYSLSACSSAATIGEPNFPPSSGTSEFDFPLNNGAGDQVRTVDYCLQSNSSVLLSSASEFDVSLKPRPSSGQLLSRTLTGDENDECSFNADLSEIKDITVNGCHSKITGVTASEVKDTAIKGCNSKITEIFTSSPDVKDATVNGRNSRISGVMSNASDNKNVTRHVPSPITAGRCLSRTTLTFTGSSEVKETAGHDSRNGKCVNTREVKNVNGHNSRTGRYLAHTTLTFSGTSEVKGDVTLNGRHSRIGQCLSLAIDDKPLDLLRLPRCQMVCLRSH